MQDGIEHVFRFCAGILPAGIGAEDLLFGSLDAEFNGGNCLVHAVVQFARDAAAQVTPGTERVPSMPPPAMEAP